MEALLSDFLDKKPDFSGLSKIDQVKYMAYFYTVIEDTPIFLPKPIRDFFHLAALPPPSNVPLCFGVLNKDGTFIKTSKVYRLHRDVKIELEKEFSVKKPIKKVSKSLKDYLDKVTDSNHKSYLKEAVACFEIGAYRASVIMVWILTLDHLYNYILTKKLNEFNKALSTKKGTKISRIKKKDDLCELKESVFIEICKSAGIITRDVRKILDEKLGFRNSCAHPNTIKIKEAKAISFFEDLFDNVILKYPVT